MRSLYYAYRRKADGVVFWKGNRPYCTKGAAMTPLSFSWIERTPEERQAYQDRYGYPAYGLRPLTMAEKKAIIATDYELVTYELKEVVA